LASNSDETDEETTMFRIYEWNFSSTIELVVAALLVTTLLAVIAVL
jgi:hypothetical protein